MERWKSLNILKYNVLIYDVEVLTKRLTAPLVNSVSVNTAPIVLYFPVISFISYKYRVDFVQEN